MGVGTDLLLRLSVTHSPAKAKRRRLKSVREERLLLQDEFRKLGLLIQFVGLDEIDEYAIRLKGAQGFAFFKASRIGSNANCKGRLKGGRGGRKSSGW